MKKKLITILVVLVLALSATFATVFQFGPSASLPLPLDFDKPENMAEPFKDFGNYQFGADLRISIPFSNVVGLSIGAPSMMSFGGSAYNLALNTTPTLDLVLAPKSILNLQAGLAYPLTIGWDKNWGFFHNFEEATAKSTPVYYHLGIGLDLIGMGLNLSYYLPGTAIDNWKPAPEMGRFVCSVYLMEF